MEMLGDILSYYQNHPADAPRRLQVHHRMAYTGTAIFTIKLLQTILPPEKVWPCVCAIRSPRYVVIYIWKLMFLWISHRLVRISQKAQQQLSSTCVWMHHWEVYYPACKRRQWPTWSKRTQTATTSTGERPEQLCGWNQPATSWRKWKLR